MSELILYGIDDLVTQIREDLDEPVNVGNNLFDDAYLIVRLNRGFREVWEAAREEKQNWFIRRLKSTDPEITLHGRAYDPAQMVLTSGISEIPLPADFYEARSLTPLVSTDGSDPQVTFIWTDIADADFRDARRDVSSASGGDFLVDVEYRATGPFAVFSPAVALDEDTDVELAYVYGPKEYQAGDSLENAGFNRVMLDAAIAYAVLEARRKEGVPANIREAEQVWKQRIALVTRSAGPRQSEQAEVVQGFQEEWI